MFPPKFKVMFVFTLNVLYMLSLDGLLCGLRYITQPNDPDEGKAGGHCPVFNLLPAKLVQVGQVDDTCVSET